MKILALEFSSKIRSVAAADTAKTSAIQPLGYAMEEEHGDTRPFRLIESCLEQVGWNPAQVEGIVIGLGPGSFTGIRTAIAIAQGWQLGRKVKGAGVSSMEVLARQLGQQDFSGRAVVAIPAQRRECHVMEYEFDHGKIQRESPLTVMERDALEERHERDGWAIVGPGVEAFLGQGTDLYPDARALWEWASAWSEFPKQTNWEPINLRHASFVKAPPARSW